MLATARRWFNLTPNPSPQAERGVMREMIGRVRRYVVSTLTRRRPYVATRDLTESDYAFFDKAEAGQIAGLEMAGLLLKPIANKTASWVLGRMPQIKASGVSNQVSAKSLEDQVNTWLQKNHAGIMRAYRQAVGKGDYYLVVNADRTLTLIPPHVVEPIVAENDYSVVIGYRIIERYDHPTEIGKWQIETNEYYADKRIRKIEGDRGVILERTYRNLIGRIPVIHMANDRDGNSFYGRPEGAALVSGENGLLYRYNDILDAGLEGNLKQGRPTPSLEFPDAESVKAFYDANADRVEVGTDEDGQPLYDEVVTFDSDRLMMAAARFSYQSPGPFAGETEKLLSILYWLILEHTEIPEFVMGTAIASSKASAETQMPVFVRWVEGKQAEVSEWFKELVQVVAALMMVSGVVQAVADLDVEIVWEELTGQDGKLTLETLTWLYSEGLIDDEAAVQLAPVDIPDVMKVLQRARALREARQQEQQQERQFQQQRDNVIDQQNQDDPLDQAA